MLLYTLTLEIALHNFTISNSRYPISKSCKLGCAILKLRKLSCTILKLVCSFAISNLRSTISKLHKISNCVMHRNLKSDNFLRGNLLDKKANYSRVLVERKSWKVMMDPGQDPRAGFSFQS